MLSGVGYRLRAVEAQRTAEGGSLGGEEPISLPSCWEVPSEDREPVETPPSDAGSLRGSKARSWRGRCWEVIGSPWPAGRNAERGREQVAVPSSDDRESVETPPNDAGSLRGSKASSWRRRCREVRGPSLAAGRSEERARRWVKEKRLPGRTREVALPADCGATWGLGSGRRSSDVPKGPPSWEAAPGDAGVFACDWGLARALLRLCCVSSRLASCANRKAGAWGRAAREIAGTGDPCCSYSVGGLGGSRHGGRVRCAISRSAAGASAACCCSAGVTRNASRSSGRERSADNCMAAAAGGAGAESGAAGGRCAACCCRSAGRLSLSSGAAG